ncbi:MAG: O-methyltransferase [Phycisphaerales bacterium]|nr:O-methyltransferase [Phycisphaerales bacterium]
MTNHTETWSAVDAACDELLGSTPRSVSHAAARCIELGLPAISVSPMQGRFLMLMARLSNAKRILEIGTLGGYSTAWLAEGLAPGGLVTTIELNETWATNAEQTFREGGIADRVEVRRGAALSVMAGLTPQPDKFDLVFIDADKENSANYVDLALQMTRVGGLIIVDNVIREGAIVDANHPDERVQGSRRAIARMGEKPLVAASVLQTVGMKGYDGFAIALVGTPRG